MVSYNIELKPSVHKDFKRLPKTVLPRVWEAIKSFTHKPLPPGVEKISAAEGLYRTRVGDYRIVYRVDHQAHKVTIQHVRHRSIAYRNL